MPSAWPRRRWKPSAAGREMPSTSAKQRRFMAAAANNPSFAKKAGIPQSVAREYHEADKAKTRMSGGGFRHTPLKRGR